MKTFLITGASSGIGAETARQAVAAGYRVALAARSAGKLDALVAELGPGKAMAVACDVASAEAQEAMVAKVLEAYGRIDVAFANAGIGSTAPGVEHGDPDNWRDMIMTNVFGCFVTAKLCLPEIRARRGHIVLTGSLVGRVPMKGSIYSATKWAVTGFGYNLRKELEGTGARMTLLEPGLTDTGFFGEAKPEGLRPDDVARAVLYAVSQPDHVDVAEIMVLPARKE